MPSFTMGEEVLYRGRRYVVTLISPRPPYEFRVVASTPDGARVAWATIEELHKMDAYRQPYDDTGRY